MASEAARLGELRDRLWDGLSENLGGVRLNGSREHRLPHNLNVSFDGVDGESLLLRLSEHMAVSSGSACTTSEPEPSHVLRAIGVPGKLAHASIRFGLGRSTTAADVSAAIDKTCETVARLRETAVPQSL
jgi:cysteine desulfurase